MSLFTEEERLLISSSNFLRSANSTSSVAKSSSNSINAEKPINLLPHGIQLMGKSAANIMQSGFLRSGGIGGNDIGYGFGLCKIHLAVKKCSLCKLSCPCQSCAAGNTGIYNLLLNVRAAMATDLDGILAGKAFLPPEKRKHYFIQNIIAVFEHAYMHGMRRLFGYFF